MDRFSRFRWIALFLFVSFLAAGCAGTGSGAKAPITPLLVGGTTKERQQELALRRIKWQHTGKQGKILGAQYFKDAQRPIPGVQRRDTLIINDGPFRGVYTIENVLRLREGQRRDVLIKIAESFPVVWKTAHQGSGGLRLDKNVFSDASSLPPDVLPGARLLITGSPTPFTIIGQTVVQVPGTTTTRVGYKVEEPLPDLRSASYQILTPDEAAKPTSTAYQIDWRGGALTGRFYTIGINRRRYTERAVEDLLQSEAKSKEALSGASAKQATALVFQIIGGLAVGVGGYLALVNRDDFPDARIGIPLGIVGGGVVFILASLPLLISRNNDYLRAAQAFNLNLEEKLGVKDETLGLSPKTPSSPSRFSRLSPALPPAKTVLLGKQD